MQSQGLGDFVEAKFYCLHTLADGKEHIRISEKMLEFSSIPSKTTTTRTVVITTTAAAVAATTQIDNHLTSSTTTNTTVIITTTTHPHTHTCNGLLAIFQLNPCQPVVPLIPWDDWYTTSVWLDAILHASQENHSLDVTCSSSTG